MPKRFSSLDHKSGEARLLPTLTHISKPPLGEGHDAVAYPKELLHQMGHSSLLPPLPALLFDLVSLWAESTFGLRSRLVCCCSCGTGTHPTRRHRTKWKKAYLLVCAHFQNSWKEKRWSTGYFIARANVSLCLLLYPLFYLLGYSSTWRLMGWQKNVAVVYFPEPSRFSEKRAIFPLWMISTVGQ